MKPSPLIAIQLLCLLVVMPLNAMNDPLQRFLKPEPEPEASKRPADTWILVSGCFGCHGEEGRSAQSPIPSLAGLSSKYIYNVMIDYQHGGRYGTVMDRIAMGYSNEEIRRIAAYFSEVDEVPIKQRTDRKQFKKGRKLHKHYCSKCHGAGDTPPKKGSPPLKHQWMDYLRWTMKDYMVGINQSHPRMDEGLTGLVRKYGEDGLESLVHYYGSNSD